MEFKYSNERDRERKREETHKKRPLEVQFNANKCQTWAEKMPPFLYGYGKNTQPDTVRALPL